MYQLVSLHIFTIDYNGRSFSGLAQYAVYADVHDVQYVLLSLLV
jgi:hypothetical protein